MPGADLHTLMDAALTELDAAIEAISEVSPAVGAGDAETLPEAVRAAEASMVVEGTGDAVFTEFDRTD